MIGTWGGGRTPVWVWYVRGVCVVNRCGGGWGGSVTPGGGPMGDCPRPIHIWALPRSCSYGPGGGGGGAGRRVLGRQGIQGKQGIRVSWVWPGGAGAPRGPWRASLGAGGAGQSKQTRHSYPSGLSQQGGAALDRVWVAAPPLEPPRSLWACIHFRIKFWPVVIQSLSVVPYGCCRGSREDPRASLRREQR